MAIPELELLKSSTLLSQTGLLVAASDAAGRIALLSRGMQELFEMPFEPVREDEISSRFRLFTADGRAPLPNMDVPLVRARRGEVVRDALITSRPSAGCLLHPRCNASPLISHDGRPSGAIVLVQDVTGERVAQARQDELRERLLETINHQLRTPVTSLLGYAEMLVDQRAGILPEAQYAVNAVLRASQALTTLLETISALVDLDGHTEVAKTYGDLSAALQHAARTVTPLFDDNDVELRLDHPSRLPVVMDFAQVRRAVCELLKNAASYAPAGSVVRLRARCQDGALVDITVTDNGPGIDGAERERLVQPFERGAHPQQEVGGRGLGLAIAQTVAGAHGGELQLSTHRPQGLSARLRLPVR